MIRKKILWAGIIGLALVGGAIGALAIRSARNDAVTTTTTPEALPQASDQTQPTAGQPATERAAQPENPKTAANATSGRRSSNRSVYYNYSDQSSKRSFWDKHRDKLTVAAGAGAGALVGGLIGGKKGAGIGLLGGGAGSALYTYKLRHKRHRY